MMAKVTVKADVQMPRLPNFLFLAGTEGKLDVADMADDALRAIGVAWTENLLEHAANRRKLDPIRREI